MNFEFDPGKSASNRLKHGIDFEEAKSLWGDERLLVVAARTSDEPRFIAIGMIGRRHRSAIYTLRNGIGRLISVRRSRIEEVRHYDGE